jgi:hypothetical protein
VHECSRHQDRDRGFFDDNQFDRGVCDRSRLEVSQFTVGGMRGFRRKGLLTDESDGIAHDCYACSCTGNERRRFYDRYLAMLDG